MIAKLIRSGAIFTNLALSGYIVFIHELLYDYFFHDYLFESSRETLVHQKTNYLLAALLIIVSVMEFIAYRWKAQARAVGTKKKKSTDHKNGAESEDDQGSTLVIIWIFHLVLSAVIVMSALTALNLSIEDHPLIGFLLMAMMVIKEIFILAAFWSDPPKEPLPRWKSILSDVFLTFFYTIIFTVVISNILYTDNYDNFLLAYSYSKVYMGINIFIIMLLFYIFYLPLRMPYFFEEDENESDGKFFLNLFAMILVGASTILPLFEGYTSVDEALKNKDEARILFLNRKDLKEIPADVFKLNHLEALHLGGNQIESVPAEIKDLKKIKWLYLGSNHLKRFPEGVQNLPHLKELFLHMNKVEKFPADLSWTRKLTKITYYSNPMKYDEKIRLDKILKGKNKK